MRNDNYVIKSLELHLFFGRIMKEHSFFLKAGFTPANSAQANQAEHFKSEFEKLLCKVVSLSGGVITEPVICSGEIFTEFTKLAENQTERFTGISINKDITDREISLVKGCGGRSDPAKIRNQVREINRTALRLVNGLISFKESVLKSVLHCEMFTVNYPLLIEHILREARLYRDYILTLEREGDLSIRSMKEVECFWNQIMMEHALFIRGLLDPTENELIQTADGFAKEYAALLETCRRAQRQTMTAESLEQTVKLRDFKIAGVQGIEQCKIRSLILPLLADHVLREANHYIRLMRFCGNHQNSVRQ